MSAEVKFSYANSRVPVSELTKQTAHLARLVKRLKDVTRATYEEPESCINLCADTQLHEKIHALVKTVRTYNPKLLVVIGIGGSNLGTMAIQQLAQGKLHNERTNALKVLYADTVDSDEIAEIADMVTHTLKKKERVVLNVISKSGTTTETIANFEVLLEILKKHDKDYHKCIIVTTDEGTPLHTLAQQQNFHILPIPSCIGGRYSVLSAVGLFPLELAGISIDRLLKGAHAMRTRCLANKQNPALTSAIIRAWHAHHGQSIQDLFLFGNDFKSLGKWYRQLFAESLGKGCDTNGRICIGITPTYSIGSTDMHSIAQLYLGGPFDKLTSFVRVEKNRQDLKTPSHVEYEKLVPHIQKTSLQTIMHAIYQGVTATFVQKKRPFTELTLPDKSPYAIGQFIQFQMMEVIYLAHLLNVNPFDQPDIESYKQETRKRLAKR